ncbi:unnamed protein product [Vicia faba]|uniref:Uncharacterized protein n=1 Tax=Vicia faba TaxID=3906 RepID=A0AAV0YTT4_VICFA|nr:unnamed protein product [Vicia faba]
MKGVTAPENVEHVGDMSLLEMNVDNASSSWTLIDWENIWVVLGIGVRWVVPDVGPCLGPVQNILFTSLLNIHGLFRNLLQRRRHRLPTVTQHATCLSPQLGGSYGDLETTRKSILKDDLNMSATILALCLVFKTWGKLLLVASFFQSQLAAVESSNGASFAGSETVETPGKEKEKAFDFMSILQNLKLTVTEMNCYCNNSLPPPATDSSVIIISRSISTTTIHGIGIDKVEDVYRIKNETYLSFVHPSLLYSQKKRQTRRRLGRLRYGGAISGEDET